MGLNSDMTEADIQNQLADKSGHHDSGKLCMRNPARWGTNYDKTDSLSVYKVLPKGVKPVY